MLLPPVDYRRGELVLAGLQAPRDERFGNQGSFRRVGLLLQNCLQIVDLPEIARVDCEQPPFQIDRFAGARRPGSGPSGGRRRPAGLRTEPAEPTEGAPAAHQVAPNSSATALCGPAASRAPRSPPGQPAVASCPRPTVQPGRRQIQRPLATGRSSKHGIASLSHAQRCPKTIVLPPPKIVSRRLQSNAHRGIVVLVVARCGRPASSSPALESCPTTGRFDTVSRASGRFHA